MLIRMTKTSLTPYQKKVLTFLVGGFIFMLGMYPAHDASATVTTYTTPGTTSWVAPTGITSVSYLVVAGGAGGGSGYGGGGGGAGGVLTGTLSVTPGASYTVTVGSGGAGASGALNSGYGGLGGAGGNSVFSTFTAIGGGGGNYGGGASGGSGGGGGGNGGAGGGAGTGGQGYNGGAAVAGPVNYGGGGGGGAGGAGSQAPSSQNGGTGGPGYTSSISGSSHTYAAGGGGGGEGGTGGSGGSSNTGGHGGGGGGNVGITSPTYYGSGGGGGGGSPGGQSGTSGYQGIVIISYTSSAPTVTTNSASSVVPTEAVLFGTITSNGNSDATQSGFAYGTASNLSTVIATTTLGAQSGNASFSSSVTGLSANTTYYYRAYVTNSVSTAYGSIQSFASGNSTPARRMRLFEGFKVKFVSGKMIINQQ